MIEKNIILSNKSISSYYDELKNDLNLNITNIKEKSFLVSSTRTKWVMYLFKEKENLEKIKAKRKEIIDKELKNNTNPSLSKLKTINSFKKNDIIIKLDLLYKQVKETIDFLEYILSIMNDYGFAVKNVIDILKLEQM
jgi:hypothetical protein